MTKEEIGYLVLVLLALFFIFLFILIITIRKQMPLFLQAKSTMSNQTQIVVLQKKEQLEIPVSYYQQVYTYQAIFQDIYTKKEIVLYVTKDQELDLLEKEDYTIMHDGVVLFETRRSYWT
ncbi:MAG: hypothetical protein NC182_03660 [Prevotella sp.]|nr:hypothetical protein [Staphylococcus sp.]MCM1350275.1 hypothetical protein [Prevotella sp.]